METKKNYEKISGRDTHDNLASTLIPSNRPLTRQGPEFHSKSFGKPDVFTGIVDKSSFANGKEHLEIFSNELEEISSVSEFLDEYKSQKTKNEGIYMSSKHEDKPDTFLLDPAFIELKQKLSSTNYKVKKDHIWSIEDAKNHPEAIDQWIQSIQALHTMKQTLSSKDKHDFPSLPIHDLVLPAELKREILSASDKDVRVPDPKLDISLDEYAEILCYLLDIPVDAGSIIYSIHTMFHLYLQIKDTTMESL